MFFLFTEVLTQETVVESQAQPKTCVKDLQRYKSKSFSSLLLSLIKEAHVQARTGQERHRVDGNEKEGVLLGLPVTDTFSI